MALELLRLARLPRLPSSFFGYDDDDPLAVPVSLAVIDAADKYALTHENLESAGAGDNEYFARLLSIVRKVRDS